MHIRRGSRHSGDVKSRVFHIVVMLVQANVYVLFFIEIPEGLWNGHREVHSHALRGVKADPQAYPQLRTMMEQRIKVAVPAPFFHALDYLVGPFSIRPGCRVLVPLGRRQVVGIALSEPSLPDAPDLFTCRPVSACLDETPLLPEAILDLCAWASAYYHHPIGEVLAAALPASLRKPDKPGRRTAKAATTPDVPGLEAPAATDDQRVVLEGLAALPDGFSVSLLEGVTGSGKTEIYLQRVESILAHGGQALVLTPEIGLTPQLVERFRARFGSRVSVFHSGLGEKARTESWRAAQAGTCDVLIGTRSAVFVPLPRLALVVVDEEHDASFKQQEGFRYSARDVAILRAQQAGIPVILGSATPSLESLHNAERGRYRHFELRGRARAQDMPQLRLIDTRGTPLVHGLAPDLLEATRRHLDAGGQALMFVNQRGYAPALLCHDCGWTAPCPHCDARLTLHRARGRLICHHCASETRLPTRCGQCAGSTLVPVGQGTERVEDGLREQFPGARIERMDSDRVGKAGELDRLLADIRSRAIHILVGTQMLAKGHDFDGLSLVGVVATDQALYSADFRAVERMAQLLTQVSGRAGRGTTRGEVLVQTREPEHPQLQAWLKGGYRSLAKSLIEERRVAGLPPFAYLAMLRADALEAGSALKFLRHAADTLQGRGVDIMGPVPAPMERRANRYRAQLLLRSTRRAKLQSVLSISVPELQALPGARKVRWSVDVDPIDLY